MKARAGREKISGKAPPEQLFPGRRVSKNALVTRRRRKPMSRKISLALLAAVVAALFATAARAQTVDELVEKNVKAKGGREKLAALKSYRMTGKMALPQGMEAPFTMEFATPHKMRMEFTVQGMTGIQAYDGTTGWMVMPFMGKTEPEPMSAEQMKGVEDQGDLQGPLFDYKAKGNQVELVGKQDVDGTPAYKLKVTRKSGDSSYLYLDGEYFLELKEEGTRHMQGRAMEYETTFGDYKQVEGMTFPFTLNIKSKGMPGAPTQTITVEKIEINPTLAAERFAMPKPAKPDDKKPEPKGN
jgi:outer membrane lipoprotein-sorting protein